MNTDRKYLIFFSLVILLIFLAAVITIFKPSSNEGGSNKNKESSNKHEGDSSSDNVIINYSLFRISSDFAGELEIKHAWNLFQITHDTEIITESIFKHLIYSLYLITKVADRKNLSILESDLFSQFQNYIEFFREENGLILEELFGTEKNLYKYFETKSLLFSLQNTKDDYLGLTTSPYYINLLENLIDIIRDDSEIFLPVDLLNDLIAKSFTLNEVNFSPLEFMLFNWINYILNQNPDY